jgi:uncharacterized protein YxjI
MVRGMADAWTRYKLMRRLFAIGEDFWIEDDGGRQQYMVDGKALSLRHMFVLQDSNGAELLTGESKLIAIQPTMKLERQGQVYATITKALFTFLHQHYTIEVAGGPTYDAEGDITNHEYAVQNQGAPVAQISRAWFSIHDSYGIAIAPGMDVPLLLAAAVCIDEIAERGRERNR